MLARGGADDLLPRGYSRYIGTPRFTRAARVFMHRKIQAPAGNGPVAYRFGDLRLKADGTLQRGGTVLAIPAEELSLLRALIARRGEVVPASELSRALWGNAQVEAHRLVERISSLKRMLQPSDCIESVYRQGYRIQAIAEQESALQPSFLPRVAILPFSAGYKAPDYLGHAIAEDTAEHLRKLRPTLAWIAAQDSVQTLTRRSLGGQEIGKLLDAELLVTGQLLATPGRYRLRVEAMRVKDGAPLWIEDMVVEREKAGKLARELANRVAARLHGGIHIDAVATASTESTADEQEAKDLFLRAHYEWQSLERHHMQDAMGRLLRAIEVDRSLMAARVELARIAVAQCIYGYMSPRIAAATVRRAAGGIPELNDQAVALLPALGWIEFHIDRDPRSALRLLARSEGLPFIATNALTRLWFLCSLHKFGEAVESVRAALVLNPFSSWLQACLAWALHLAGEREASVVQAVKLLEMFPEFDKATFFAAIILAYNGEAERAVEVAESLAKRSSHYDLALSALAYALACAGRGDEARHQLGRLHWLSQERFVLTTPNAATHLILGDTEKALAELRVANETRCPWFFQMLADPRLQSIEGQPVFAELKAEWEAMAAEATAYSN